MLRQYRTDTRTLNWKVASNNEPSKVMKSQVSSLLFVDVFLPRSRLATITPALNNAIATKGRPTQAHHSSKPLTNSAMNTELGILLIVMPNIRAAPYTAVTIFGRTTSSKKLINSPVVQLPSPTRSSPMASTTRSEPCL